jgi:membrane protein
MNRLVQAVLRFRAFVRDELWEVELQPRTWASRGVNLLRFTVVVGEGFVRDHLLLRASALTYFTVLSIVPVLAIVGAIATALGVTENVVGTIVDQIARVVPEAGDKILDFVENANIGGLGTLGAVALFLTTVLGISNIERTLNHIWGVKQNRPWSRRLPDYLAVLIVAPLLLGAGLSMATTIKSQWFVQKLLELPGLPLLYELGLKQLPLVVLASAFGFLYWFLPNTTVRPFAALLGGAVAAIGVNAALTIYVGASVGFARANALYGGFAALPLLFVWIYFFWAIVLLGAEIAFAYQNLDLYAREVRGERAGPAERIAIGLRIAVEIARSFRDRDVRWGADELADALRVPVRTVRVVLAELQGARIVSTVGPSEKEGGLQLGRPAEDILVTDVVGVLRGLREPVRGDPVVGDIVERALAELAEGEAKAAAGQTLADLLAGVPVREAAPAR